MPEDIRLWEIEEDHLEEISETKLDMEERLEEWLSQDISIISSDLLVIGRQEETDFGGVIDLLCLDRDGNLVIVELKRDRTPREITAQVLDYASWVKDLSNERITEIADRHLSEEGPLSQAFNRKFGEELPEILNEHHRMLVVASATDSSSERIIKYLSDTYGVDINAITFQYFQDTGGRQFLARVFLIEPSEVKIKSQTRSTSKRAPRLTYEDLQREAEHQGVGGVYGILLEGLTRFFDHRRTTRSSVAFIGVMDDVRNTIFSLLPSDSEPDKGIRYQVYIERFSQYFGQGKEDAINMFPPGWEEDQPWKSAPATIVGFFKDRNQADNFLGQLADLRG